MREQPLHVPGDRLVALDQLDGRARRLEVQLGRILDALRLRAEPGQHGHLARQRGAQRVDGLDAQPRRVRRDTPPGLGVARERGSRELDRRSLVLARGRLCGARVRERVQHALAHLAGGLAGEGDGDDLLGMLHAREQPQVALDQELGLAGARWRLHDERARGVERAAARGEIGYCGSVHSASSSSAFSMRS